MAVSMLCSNGHAAPRPGCAPCVDREEEARVANTKSAPAMSRDSLLHEISRSLRETHPENAEVMIRELERWMPPEGTVGALVAQPSDPPPRLRFW